MKCSQGLFIVSACTLIVGGCAGDGFSQDDSGASTSGGVVLDDSGIPTSNGPTTSDATSGTADSTSLPPNPLEDTGETAESSTGFVEPVCGEANFVLEAVPPNVALVLDKSGSMVIETWDADQDDSTPDVTRWLSLHNVVSFILDSFDEKVNFGAVLFPSEDALSQFSPEGCAMQSSPEVPVAPSNGAAILDAIPGATAGDNRIQGGTPAAEGVRVAREHLMTLDPTIERFMILVTDGAANCSDDFPECSEPGCDLFEVYDEDLPAVVQEAFDVDGIPTFVVGIDILDEVIGEGEFDGRPAVNTFEKLNEVSEAGGRARDSDEKFFNALNEADLQEALEQIAGQVFSCTVPLTPAPDHPRFVEIEIDGETVPKVEDCETEDGWVFVDEETFDTIRLCNVACSMLGIDGKLDAIYKCPPPG